MSIMFPSFKKTDGSGTQKVIKENSARPTHPSSTKGKTTPVYHQRELERKNCGFPRAGVFFLSSLEVKVLF
jgi:hypothetical protein